MSRSLARNLPDARNDPSLLWAAVAVIISPDPDSLLLIRRADRAGDPWSGHMALPGGRRDPGDGSLLDTAIREAEEEVGITLRTEHLLGTLEDVIPRTPVLPPIAVRPFVFLIPTRSAHSLSGEVASVSWLALDQLLQPGSRRMAHVVVAGVPREVLAYEVENATVWGMTERIFTGLVQHLSE